MVPKAGKNWRRSGKIILVLACRQTLMKSNSWIYGQLAPCIRGQREITLSAVLHELKIASAHACLSNFDYTVFYMRLSQE